MYTGPHIIKDGLVFGYDTGYGVADNDISTRFYSGQPTTNIVPLSLSNSSWYNEYSSGRTLRSETLFGQPAYEFKSNDGQIWVSPFYFNSYDRSTNDLTLSVYAKNIGSSAVSMNTYFGGDYSSDSLGNGNTKSIPADNTWRRYSWTRFSSAMNANHLEFRTANTGVVISCPQLEIGRVVTPIVNGTRSSTTSLIDLKGTTDIDVSNVTFDSAGQPTFDGSSDKIELSSYLTNLDTSILSLEFVFRTNIGTGTYQPLLGWHYGRAGHGYVCLGNFTGQWSNESISFYNDGDGATSLSFAYTNGHSFLGDTNYHHAVIVLQTGNYRIYVDGEEVTINASFRNGSQSTVMQSNLFGYGTGPKVGIGVGSNTEGYLNGRVPITKIYNRALTASEIKQNFNAYKNRFNI